MEFEEFKKPILQHSHHDNIFSSQKHCDLIFSITRVILLIFLLAISSTFYLIPKPIPLWLPS